MGNISISTKNELNPKNENSMVDYLVGTLTDPIVAYPVDGNSLSEWLKTWI
jgi:hypothetical protein